VSAADPFLTISAALDAQRPDLARTELALWRRVTKVCEESGEVWRALSGYVAENPRKGQTHTLDDLRGELLDTAAAALCAWAHVNGNVGDPLGALLAHVAGTAARLRVAGVDVDVDDRLDKVAQTSVEDALREAAQDYREHVHDEHPDPSDRIDHINRVHADRACSWLERRAELIGHGG
jgi:NTP pyrophosphatase (non-canonical NTP hydrolase)